MQFEKSKCFGHAKGNASLSFSQSLVFTIYHPVLCVVFLMCSYNKLEDDFQSEADPLRAYNDYLEDVESISKSYVSLTDT